MDASLLINNLLSAPVLFFLLGLLANWVRSDLSIPTEISKFLSLYLLFSLGLKGGAELAHSLGGNEVFLGLGSAILLAFLVPFYVFPFLKKKTSIPNAGAIAATYGSVSAVTFITAVAFLRSQEVNYGGFMVAALALMESPAIMVGVFLVRRNESENGEGRGMKEMIHEALTNGSVFLILGSVLIGLVLPESQFQTVTPFIDAPFKGILAFFMLDMGLLAGRRLAIFKNKGAFFILFSLIVPVVNAFLAIFLSYAFGLSVGNALLLTILAASASYIAVPAAMRIAVPEANPGLYVPMSLGITFPFNILVGIPMYYLIIEKLLGS
ncbi:MAG: sodium-dependent bicarbonate transport family permease [Bacteroidota bacterium]|nr:sodium-dependent bicarbonate transport family permease [Bacteroidota bacterium]MDX5447832.1 sodium-dependent bicarbonate transport family permease [Bacteroidota bacterium]MDX5505811.1 sodium-dependent bicarbonate transport family permease [Bacteroidota bacterium]